MSASVTDELRTAFEEPFWALGRDAARDARTVVVSWPSVPVEIVRAAGFTPVFARGRNAPTPTADRVLERDLFPRRLRQLVEAALTGRLSHVAAVVLPRSSDPDYKCFLYLRELVRRHVVTALPPVLLFDLLHSDDGNAREYNAARVRTLADRLAKLAGRSLRTDDLRPAIASANRARAAARRLGAQRAAKPRITGTVALPLLGAFWQVEPERYAGLAAAAAESIVSCLPLEGTRVLLAGAPVDSTELHAALEAEGAVVVAELSPFGGSGVGADVDDSSDSFTAVAEHCRSESIDARVPVTSLMRKLDDALEAIDAVIVSLPPDDASFGWDYPEVRTLLARRSIPHEVLASDPTLGVTAVDRERIRALLQSGSTQRGTPRG